MRWTHAERVGDSSLCRPAPLAACVGSVGTACGLQLAGGPCPGAAAGRVAGAAEVLAGVFVTCNVLNGTRFAHRARATTRQRPPRRAGERTRSGRGPAAREAVGVARRAATSIPYSARTGRKKNRHPRILGNSPLSVAVQAARDSPVAARR